MDEVSVQVGDIEYRGWETVTVQRSVESAVGSVELTLQDQRPLPVSTDQEVVVRYGADPVLTGRFDLVDIGIGPDEKPFRVQGRDIAADMLDSSAVHETGSWYGVRLDQLAEDLARPFGVSVQVDGDVGEPFTVFALEPSESAWEALERAARFRGFLARSQGDGQLLLDRSGSQAVETPLVEGQNIRTARLRINAAERFATYIVRGQRAGSDDDWGASATLVEAQAQDDRVTRRRTLVLLAEAGVTEESARRRAEWEATVRAARSETLEVTVHGWRERVTAGPLWEVNRRVRVIAPTVRLEDSELLIAATRFSLDEQDGLVTTLTLVRTDAYQPVTTIEDPSPFEDVWR